VLETIRMSFLLPKQRVLILCTGNSCRSQMAEAIWRHEAGDRYEVYSAGTEPKGINPRTGVVLKELSISLDGHRSKDVREFFGQPFDLVITVCDHARETCPVFPGAKRQEHWPFDDPAAATGSEDEILSVFRRVRDQFRARIRQYAGNQLESK
jgi:arsenate reductase